MDLKCVVIDDEGYAVNALVNYINKMHGLSVYRTFTKPTQALAEISALDDIDIIFLDIEMPEISGLDLSKCLRDKTKFMVFTTSHAKHALTAFGLNANQYLLKPITFANFVLTIDFLLKSISVNSIINESKQNSIKAQIGKLKFIKADQRNAYHYIDPIEITHIQASKNEVIIYTLKEEFNTNMGLNHMEAALSKEDFIRISKSYIIAKSAIKKIEGNQVKLRNNLVLQIGEVYKSTFSEFVKKDMF